MRISPRYRSRAESVGQMSMLGDLDALVDFVLFGDENPYTPQWQPQEVTTLKDAFLVENLESLNDSRLNPKESHDILSWIFDNELVSDDEECPPFSFQDCCRSAGVSPFEIRSQMRPVIQALEAERYEKIASALDRGKPRTVQAIKKWAEESKPTDFFSLEEVCAAAGANPDAFRARIFSA